MAFRRATLNDSEQTRVYFVSRVIQFQKNSETEAIIY